MSFLIVYLARFGYSGVIPQSGVVLLVHVVASGDVIIFPSSLIAINNDGPVETILFPTKRSMIHPNKPPRLTSSYPGKNFTCVIFDILFSPPYNTALNRTR
jgi:hypothetical protein